MEDLKEIPIEQLKLDMIVSNIGRVIKVRESSDSFCVSVLTYSRGLVNIFLRKGETIIIKSG